MGNLKTGVQESGVLGAIPRRTKIFARRGKVLGFPVRAHQVHHIPGPKLGSLLFSYLVLEPAVFEHARSLATDPGLDERLDRFNQPGRIDWLVQMDLESCLPRF